MYCSEQRQRVNAADPLRQLELILAQLLRRQGFSAGVLGNQQLSLSEVVARDGAMPLFLAQAAMWADLSGIPLRQDGCEIVPDDTALVTARVVWAPSQLPTPRVLTDAPLLLFVNQVVHALRDKTRSEHVSLDVLVDPPRPGVFDALSVRGWPTLHASRLGQ
jgi:hypothetical protein